MQSNNDKGGMIHEKNVVGRLAELYRTNRNIGIISNRIIEHNTKSYLLMEFADGNLNELHTKVNLLNDKNIFKILYHTSKILETLSFHNLFYTDLKPDNILYKIKEGDRIEVVLGDIGGICLGDYYEATPEYSSHEILVFNQGSCNHINSIWGLMIIFLRAFNYDPNYIYVKDRFSNEFRNKTGIDIDALTKTVTQIEKTPIEKNIIIIYKMYYFDYLRKEIYNNMIRFKHGDNEVTEVMNVYAKYFMFIASSNDFSISIKDVSMIFQQMMDRHTALHNCDALDTMQINNGNNYVIMKINTVKNFFNYLDAQIQNLQLSPVQLRQLIKLVDFMKMNLVETLGDIIKDSNIDVYRMHKCIELRHNDNKVGAFLELVENDINRREPYPLKQYFNEIKYLLNKKFDIRIQ